MNFNFIYRAGVAAALMAAPLTAAADLLPGFVFMGTDTGAAQPLTYLSVNAQGRTFAELRIEFFDNELSLNPVADIDLLPLLQHNGDAVNEVIGLNVPGVTSASIFRLKHRYDGDADLSVGNYSNGVNDIVYWTDAMDIVRASTSQGGSGTANRSAGGLNGGKLRIANQEYGKGVSISSANNFKNTRTSDLNNFVRFKADFGFQYQQPNGSVTMLLSQDPGNKRIYTGSATQNIQSWDIPITTAEGSENPRNLNNNKTLAFWISKDREVTIGAPRFYTAPYQLNRQPQTVTLNTAGGDMPMTTLSVPLDADVQAGGPVMFRIVSGADVATLQGNVLVPTWGKTGTVTVEAYSLGDAAYEPAVSQRVSFTFNRVPWIEHIGSALDEQNRPVQYVAVNPAGRTLTELTLETVSELSLEVIEQTDLLPQLADPAAPVETVVETVMPNGNDIAYRIRYRYEGDESAATTPLSNGVNEIHYWTDFMGIQRGSGNSYYSGGAYADGTADGQQLRIAEQTYAKGLCIPDGSSCVNTRSQNLRGYVRFKADYGLQYGSAGYDSGSASFLVANPGRVLTGSANMNIQNLDYTIGASGCNLNEANALSFWNGKEGKSIVLGAARFYAAPKQRPNDQTISWTDHVDVMHNRPFVQELTATASSGLPVSYRVIEGNEYARVIDGNKLDVFRIPDVRDRIVVEAWQPGAHLYNAAPRTTCAFEMVHGLEVRPGQRAVLDRDETLQEICIYGDRSATGQVVVNGAMIDARKIVLKYTFIPGEWNHLTFPSDINLDQASDLSAKGYELNNPSPHSGGYFVQEFDTQLSAESPESSPWHLLDSPELKGRKGYVMKLSEGLGKEPVEVTFTFDNSQLNLKSEGQPMMVSFDLSQMRPFTSQDIYIKALGVNSNTLKVKLDFQPEHPEALPVNYEAALEQMRVTLTPDGSGLRLTLPNQEPARVAIFDRRGKRLLKAVSYVSPYLLDISDLKPGTYSMAVQYGDHTATRTFTVPKR